MKPCTMVEVTPASGCRTARGFLSFPAEDGDRRLVNHGRRLSIWIIITIMECIQSPENTLLSPVSKSVSKPAIFSGL